ncbi:MAG: leucine-rich repeat protein, partial [Clostridia bacterium]|nr:leucine-rich repeat protein [Clostridia bacterium]
MKKLLLRVLSAAFVMLLSFALLSFTITVAADATGGMNTDALTYELDLSGVSQNGLKFKIDTQTSTAYVNGAGSPLASTDVVIPSYVLTSAGETYPVTSITSYAFNGRTDITSVTLPSTLTAIKQDAFKDCSGIGSVYISDLEA